MEKQFCTDCGFQLDDDGCERCQHLDAIKENERIAKAMDLTTNFDIYRELARQLGI